MWTVKMAHKLSYKEVMRGKTGCLALKRESLYLYKQTADTELHINTSQLTRRYLSTLVNL